MKKKKSEVDYSRGMKESHCGKCFDDDDGYCKYFVAPNACKLVEGHIDRVYWCKLFAKAKS